MPLRLFILAGMAFSPYQGLTVAAALRAKPPPNHRQVPPFLEGYWLDFFSVWHALAWSKALESSPDASSV